MGFVVFPLQIAGGQLDRTASPRESLESLMLLMASTPAHGWRGAADFGLRELLAEMQHKADARTLAIKRANQALRELGIEWATVQGIASEPDPELGSLRYVFKMNSDQHGSLELRVTI
jgi:hypothetical protein